MEQQLVSTNWNKEKWRHMWSDNERKSMKINKKKYEGSEAFYRAPKLGFLNFFFDIE